MSSPHPLVTITFRQELPDPNPDGFVPLKFERHWYHVPRVGDTVVLVPGDDPLAFTVKSVTWHELSVTVWFE